MAYPSNSPTLYIPEPDSRPADTPNFSHIKIPDVGASNKPDVLAPVQETFDLALGLIRVLDKNGHASGAWNPQLSVDIMQRGLKNMLLTRTYDERMFNLQRQGKMSFYMKCTGEEAIAVAQTMALRDTDMLFPSYRVQGALISRGCSLKEMMCQLLSNAGDHLKGRQMPIMYSSLKHRFYSISGNLGTQLPQAVGWAMASAYKDSDEVAITWCGEGTTAEGDFHYALNFASTYHAPVILNVTNNQWAISSFQGIALGSSSTFASKGLGYGLPSLRVDGNDFLAVYAATQWAAERARKGGGATLIELFTYRAEGHSTSDDPSKYRPKKEPQVWPLGDPIERLKLHLIELGEWSDEQHAALSDELSQHVINAFKEAEALGSISTGTGLDVKSMFEDVYEEMPDNLRRQRQQLGV